MKSEPAVPFFQTIGIGAGPSNLSLAALFQSATEEKIALFDKQPGPAWHPTLLHSGVRMQTGWLKDLVSLVDPTHRLSFLNYAVTTGRLYALLNSQFDVIPRIEYQRYLAWAAQQLGNISYGVNVDRISFTDSVDGFRGFVIYQDGTPLARSEHLVLALGTRPVMPDYFAGLPIEGAFTADELGARIDAMDRDAAVAVVGGGQTGFECVFRLLGTGFTDIRWFTRQQWFKTIDDSPVANELYRPSHTEFLQGLTRPTRRRLIDDAKLTGDALTPGALRALYQANYDGLLALGRFPVTFLPGRSVTGGEASGEDIVLRCTSPDKHEEHRIRHLVVATGREHVTPPFDEDLARRIDRDEDDEMIVECDYSVRWKGRNGHRIFSLNHSRYSHGIPNASLTQLPVRAAMVLNSMFERELYPIRDELRAVEW